MIKANSKNFWYRLDNIGYDVGAYYPPHDIDIIISLKNITSIHRAATFAKVLETDLNYSLIFRMYAAYHHIFFDVIKISGIHVLVSFDNLIRNSKQYDADPMLREKIKEYISLMHQTIQNYDKDYILSTNVVYDPIFEKWLWDLDGNDDIEGVVE